MQPPPIPHASLLYLTRNQHVVERQAKTLTEHFNRLIHEANEKGFTHTILPIPAGWFLRANVNSETIRDACRYVEFWYTEKGYRVRYIKETHCFYFDWNPTNEDHAKR